MSEKVPYSELAKKLEAGPKIHTQWRHYKTGDLYLVVALAIEECSQEPMVVYTAVGVPNAVLMVRPLEEWEEEIFWNHTYFSRFTRA